MTDQPRHRRDMGGMIVGLIIMLLGAALLLDRTGVIDGFDYVNVWPIVIIVIGLAKLSHRRPDGGREGGWWVFFGVWILLSQMDVLRLHETWPLFLVALGISMVWKDARTHARVEKPDGTP
jgi:hypothetical protein